MAKSEQPIPLNQDELRELEQIFSEQSPRSEDTREWVPAYLLILKKIRDQTDPRYFFFSRAAAINGRQATPPDVFIRTYTLASLRLQGFIPPDSDQFIQKMSGRIGSNIIREIIKLGYVPTVSGEFGLWERDISGAFDDLEKVQKINRYVAWGGGPFAEYLGINDYLRKVPRTEDRRIMTLATIIACEQAAGAAVLKKQLGEIIDPMAAGVCIGSVFRSSLDAFELEGESQEILFNEFLSAVQSLLSGLWSDGQ